MNPNFTRLTVALTLLSGMALAQPTINSSFPANGSTKTYYSFDTLTTTTSPTGANYTWTFGTVTPNSMDYYKDAFMAPSATAFPTQVPSANAACAHILYTSGYPDTAFTYFSNKIDSLTWLGSRHNGGNWSYVSTNPEKQITYPFTYNSTFTDAFKKTLNSTVPDNGNVTVTADGYGTLVLGTKTINNVLRIKMVESSLRVTSAFNEYITFTHYFWVTTSFATPVMFAEYENHKYQYPSMVSYTSRKGVYVTSDYLVLGVNENTNSIASMLVYPNPANDAVNISYELSKTSDVSISIYNELGQKVVALNKTQVSAGRQTENLVTTEMNAGFYTVGIETEEGRSVSRLVITK